MLEEEEANADPAADCIACVEPNPAITLAPPPAPPPNCPTFLTIAPPIPPPPIPPRAM